MASGEEERKWPRGSLIRMAVDMAPASLMLWPTASIHIRGTGLSHAGLDLVWSIPPAGV